MTQWLSSLRYQIPYVSDKRRPAAIQHPVCELVFNWPESADLSVSVVARAERAARRDAVRNDLRGGPLASGGILGWIGKIFRTRRGAPVFHVNVPARKLAARLEQYVVSLHFWGQRRRLSRTLQVPRLLSTRGIAGDGEPGGDLSALQCADRGGEWGDRGRAGSLFCGVSPRESADVVLYLRGLHSRVGDAGVLVRAAVL